MTDQPERCPGSLQQTMTADSPSTCPACGALVPVVTYEGVPALVEHQRKKPEASPLPLDLW